MTKDEALKLALAWFEDVDGNTDEGVQAPALIVAIKEALARTEQWTPEDTAYRPGGLAQPEQGPIDNGITVELLERLKETLTRLGYATPEGGLEQFGARLSTQLYNLCRAADGLLEKSHGIGDKT
jgi:hypothetical protein